MATKDGGNTWTTLGPGLKRTDVRHVYAASNGWWASLSKGGWSKYDETTNKWVRTGMYVADPVTTTVAAKSTATKGKKPAATKTTTVTKQTAPVLTAFLVNDMSFGAGEWYAATTGGVLVSKDKGATWKAASKDPLTRKPSQSVEVSGNGNVWAIAEKNLLYSADKGATWESQELSFASAGNLRLHQIDDSTIFITTNMGLYGSKDAGKTWNREEVRELSFQSVAGNGTAFVAALQKHGLVASFNGGKSWQRMDDPLSQGYFPLIRTRRDGSIVAVSATEGLLSLDPNAKSASSGGTGLR
jgi:hypothetical protein